MSSLVCKVSFGSALVRRVTFNQSPHSITIETFRERIARTFSLSPEATSFRIAYCDDDGDSTEISNSHDLNEAIAYFSDEYDGTSASSSSTSRSSSRVTLKVSIVVEYEGPSLSDRGSVVGSSQMSGSRSDWDDGRRSEWTEGSSARREEWDDDRSSAYDDSRQSSSAYQSQSSAPSHRISNAPPPRPPPFDPRFHPPQPPWQLPPLQPTSRPSPQLLDDYAEPPGRPAPPQLHINGSRANPRASSDPPHYIVGSSSLSDGGASETLEQRWFRSQRSPSQASPSRSHSTPLPRTSTADGEFDLPSILSSLHLTRRPASLAPSILSSVPSELLRCCSSRCGKEMSSFRYVCSLCGPILPEEHDQDDVTSDDGTQMNFAGGPEVDDGSVQSSAAGERTPFLPDDPLGVNAAAGRIALPASPLSSPTDLSSPDTPIITSLQSQSHAQNPSSAFRSPILSPHERDGLSSTEREATPQELAHHLPLSEEDGGGFELCSDCIETEGVRHAAEMALLAKREREQRGIGVLDADRARGIGEEELGLHVGVPLRHSFKEVMKMGRGSMWQGWREVDYDDDVTCSTCGSGPLPVNRFKCVSCPKLELCLACYRAVEDIHPIHAFLAIPDRPARPRAYSDASRSSGGSERTQDYRSLSSERSLNGHGGTGPRVPPKPAKHEGVFCIGCFSDIVGPRYACSQCPSFDLCSKCEALDPPITSSDGSHASSHILLKMNVPVSHEAFSEASSRARALVREGSIGRNRQPPLPIEHERWYASRGRDLSAPSPFPPPFHAPPPPHYFGGPPPPWNDGHPTPPPPPPPGYAGAEPPSSHVNALASRSRLATREVQRQVIHRGVRCGGCRKEIVGIRWACANCPTTPTFDLCSACERISDRYHNPLHCYLRLTQPLQKPLPPLSQIVPVLHDPSTPPVPRDRLDGGGSSSSAGRDGVVLHPQVVCDHCQELIAGPWNRCCHCPHSFDVCTPCLTSLPHDPSHVFLTFTRKVDLTLFREITRLSTTNPQPLLGFSIYA